MAAPQKIACRVQSIVPHGERVYSVLLQPERAVPKFRAGQFLHLALDPVRPERLLAGVAGVFDRERTVGPARAQDHLLGARTLHDPHGTRAR